MASGKKQTRKTVHTHQQAKSTVKEQATKKNVVTGKKPGKPINLLTFSLVTTGVFFLVALFGLMHHEMWRDEHQAWLVARDANSIGGVFENMRYEGNPALWHMFLFIITRFTHNPVYMQAFHLLIACGFVFIFNRYAPFQILYKILFTFGYFPLYEYAVISRSYGLGVLLTFTVCALYKNRKTNYIWLGVILGLLANVNIYCAIISLAISGILFLDYFINQQKNKNLTLTMLAGLVISLAGFIFSIYQIWPDKNNSFPTQYATEVFDSPRWAYVASRLFSTYFYIPDLSDYHFRNTNIFLSDSIVLDKSFGAWLGENPGYWWGWVFMPIVAFILGLVIFLRKPLILLLYAGATLGLMSVYYYTLLLHYRYCGHLLILLVVCYWLAEYYPEKKFSNSILNLLSGVGRKISKPFLFLVLVFNVIGAIGALSIDANNKFSVSKDAYNYIKENRLDTLPVGGSTDFIISPLAAYMDKKIYYAQMKDYGSFTVWSKQRSDEFKFKDLVDASYVLMKNGRNKILWVNSRPFQISYDGKNFVNLEKGMIAKDLKLDLQKLYEGSIVENENYYIYIIQKVDSSTVDLKTYPPINY